MKKFLNNLFSRFFGKGLGNIPSIFPRQVKEKLDKGENIFLLDVREQREWDIVHIKDATLIPSGLLKENLHKIDFSKEVIVFCKMGGRSHSACEYLISQKKNNVKNMVGGIIEWAKEVEPSMPTY